MIAQACDEGIVRLHFIKNEVRSGAGAAVAADESDSSGSQQTSVHLDVLRRELAEYFAGRRRDFTVPLAPRGSDFEKRAWDFLLTIPYGQTRTYGAQSRAIGAPDSSRAVGRANGLNDIAILIPCHRVIGSTGRLTGYAGAIERKYWLLEHERRAIGDMLFK
jgi:O-6-methylguanine DNA methyltransferase